ncbi:MAG: PilW family protein [Candidatus Tectimicrobiota bacterium]
MQRFSSSAQRGVTIVELLLYMTLSSTLVAGIYQTFAAQQKAYVRQNSTAELQQNLRTGMYLLTKDIHSAGYNPARRPNIGFTTSFPVPNNRFTIDYATQKTIIAFTSDANGNGLIDPNNAEMIAYRFNASNHTLERFAATDTSTGGTWEAIADNVEAVSFLTLGKDGSVTTQPQNMRAVEIALLVRSDKPDPKYVDREVYKDKHGNVLCATCSGDHYHRRLLTTTAQARNLF